MEKAGLVVDDAGELLWGEAADPLDVAGAALPGDLRAQRRRDLHGVRADAAGGRVDQRPVPGPHLTHVP